MPTPTPRGQAQEKEAQNEGNCGKRARGQTGDHQSAAAAATPIPEAEENLASTLPEAKPKSGDAPSLPVSSGSSTDLQPSLLSSDTRPPEPTRPLPKADTIKAVPHSSGQLPTPAKARPMPRPTPARPPSPRPPSPRPPLPRHQPRRDPSLFHNFGNLSATLARINPQSPLGMTLGKLTTKKLYHMATIGYECYDFDKNGEGCFFLPNLNDHNLWVVSRARRERPQEGDMEWLLAKMHGAEVEAVSCLNFGDPEAQRRRRATRGVNHLGFSDDNIYAFIRADTFPRFMRKVLECMMQTRGCASQREVWFITWCKKGRHRSVTGWIIVREIFLWLGFNVRLNNA